MGDVLLIRHGMCDTVGRVIAGRSAGVHLNPAGLRQARELARWLETAAPLAESTGLAVRIAGGLEELDYGSWTGRTLESLVADPVWQRYNTARGTTRIPGGETMEEVVARASAELARMACEHPDAPVAAVTHGDVIRALLAHYAGLALDHMLRLEVAPASVCVVRVSAEPRLLAVNWRADALGELPLPR